MVENCKDVLCHQDGRVHGHVFLHFPSAHRMMVTSLGYAEPRLAMFSAAAGPFCWFTFQVDRNRAKAFHFASEELKVCGSTTTETTAGGSGAPLWFHRKELRPVEAQMCPKKRMEPGSGGGQGSRPVGCSGNLPSGSKVPGWRRFAWKRSESPLWIRWAKSRSSPMISPNSWELASNGYINNSSPTAPTAMCRLIEPRNSYRIVDG